MTCIIRRWVYGNCENSNLIGKNTTANDIAVIEKEQEITDGHWNVSGQILPGIGKELR